MLQRPHGRGWMTREVLALALAAWPGSAPKKQFSFPRSPPTLLWDPDRMSSSPAGGEGRQGAGG